MGGNLFICFDQYNPRLDRRRVEAAIQKLGTMTRLQLGLWYVKSPIDATRNVAAWRNLDKAASSVLQRQWHLGHLVEAGQSIKA